MVFAEFVADLQVIIYQNSPEHKNFSNHFEPSIFFLLDLRTFNMADRGSYACIYGGKLMVTLTNLPLEECRMEGRYLLLKHGRRFQNQQRERSRKFPTESTSPHSLTAARPNCRPKNSKCPKADFTSQQLVRETSKNFTQNFLSQTFKIFTQIPQVILKAWTFLQINSKVIQKVLK